MYIDYYPVEAIVPCVAVDDDILEIRRARRLTPIRDLLALDKPKNKLQPRCYLHKGPIDGNYAYCKCCGVTYCLPCAKQLIELNEPCWSCGSPLDIDWIVMFLPMVKNE
jgi:hypothetical protein